MAVGLETEVPWCMCKQDDAPYPVNATIRSAEDIAYHVALFIARKNGTSINYYMAYVFNRDSGFIAAFLVNIDNTKSVVVQFQNSSYELPRQSISILPDCKTVAFNTAKDSGSFVERRALGVKSVFIQDSKETKDITNYSWGYQVKFGLMVKALADIGSHFERLQAFHHKLGMLR
ncbi:hypothetical protein RND71_039519 [Anisodus tanguticus]|uniref:Beta-galactosidase beta-sandwich domain-containing protein n=1 Tax=Anisodus tanguticus TaxID=243964 RepID=A0AAE1UQQ5_9SOLA|nr:hypothetical protein RND71_039519 [Anisodus tanguticus]